MNGKTECNSLERSCYSSFSSLPMHELAHKSLHESVLEESRLFFRVILLCLVYRRRLSTESKAMDSLLDRLRP